jgi:glycosyltransferase involved in cell wall biosynthesis
MNILIVAEDFLLNGVTRHICDLANGLAEAGHMGIVAATPCEQSKRLNSQISFVPLFLCRPETDKKILSGIVKSLRILITVIQQNHIDIIHTHKRYADILGRIAARMTGIKHISTCHNEFTSHRWLSLFGDRTIAPSEPIAHMLVHVFRLPEDHVKIVYHGIKPLNRQAPEALQRQRQVLGIESDVKIVLSVGHMNRQKDRTTLIEAIHLLHARRQFDNAVCLIVGEGDECSKIQTLIHRYRLEAHIKVLPANSDIELLNNIADFCVVSSLYEAGPYVVFEAASL